MEATDMLRPMTFARVLTFVLPTALAGCATVGPNYERPEMPSPAQHRFIEGATQAESFADASWWVVFRDPALQALIREAIANNLDLRIAAARVEESRARAGIAKSFLYPAVDAVGGYNVRNGTSANGEEGAPTQDSFNGGFRLSWELDLFGRVRRETEAATAIALASEQGRRGVIVTLVGDVATDYFLLRELDLQLLIARETLALNERTVIYFQDRLDGGISNRLEVDLIRANRAHAAAAIPDLERQIAIVENSISMLLGRPPGPIPRTPLNAADTLPPQIPPGVPAELLQRRPDVVAAEQLLVAANADIGVAKALFYPRISLTSFIGGSSGDLVSFMGVEGALWSIGASALQPVYQGGRLRRNLEATQARFDAAVATYRRAAINSYREVANALVTIQKLADARIERQLGVTALEDAADLSRERYDAGLASYIEILTADENLFREQLLLAQVRGAEFRARAELYRTLGGGWQQEPAPTNP
jgi:multidrug efflux system outer membrane protein